MIRQVKHLETKLYFLTFEGRWNVLGSREVQGKQSRTSHRIASDVSEGIQGRKHERSWIKPALQALPTRRIQGLTGIVRSLCGIIAYISLIDGIVDRKRI